MAVDTEAKRWSMMQLASGPSYYPLVFNPDTSGLSAIERATVLKLYGGIAFSAAAPIIIPGFEWTTVGAIRWRNLPPTRPKLSVLRQPLGPPRHQASVVPVHLDRRHEAPTREAVVDLGRDRIRLR